GPETIVGSGRVLDQLGKGAHVFVRAAGNVETGGSKVELVFRHGVCCLDHQLFIAADLAVHSGGQGGSRLRGLLRGWRARGWSARPALTQGANGSGKYYQQ